MYRSSTRPYPSDPLTPSSLPMRSTMVAVTESVDAISLVNCNQVSWSAQTLLNINSDFFNNPSNP